VKNKDLAAENKMKEIQDLVAEQKIARLRLAAIAIEIFYALFSMHCILCIVLYAYNLMHCILFIEL
jgi:hypothetical protein